MNRRGPFAIVPYMITASELIAELKKLRPDMPVVTTTEVGHFARDPTVSRREWVIFGGQGNSPIWHAKPEDPAAIEVIWL